MTPFFNLTDEEKKDIDIIDSISTIEGLNEFIALRLGLL